MYGAKYDGVSPILIVNVWTGLFVFLDIGISNWFITESLQRFVLRRTIIGAFTNIILNFIFIPQFGAIGASVATLVTQFFISYLMNGLYSKTREVFILQTNALLFLPKFVLTLLQRTF
ncbi:polysaccharide biosynthesis C-terminal domain-containing protein [Spirosoma sp. KNUC1025]|nr:polysaccharide biosynthesis C-terminal domain-containing protein [Spirosoma sp. KNUC1025]